MTKYYTKQRYYERLCCGTIKCSEWCLGHCCGYQEGVEELIEERKDTKTDQDSGSGGHALNAPATQRLELSI